jgi:uncharacterized membrane protein YdbT with pleckstrin-like domain
MLQQIYCTPGTTCNELPLEPRKVVKKTISGVFGVFIGVLLVLVYFFALIADYLNKSKIDEGLGTILFLFIGIPSICFLIVLVLVYIYQRFYYKNYFYNLTSEMMVVKKGVISRSEITLQYDKIQNVFVDQDILDRMFGLYDLHIENAGGSSSAAAHIDGLNEQNAEKMKEFILNKIKRRPSL